MKRFASLLPLLLLFLTSCVKDGDLPEANPKDQVPESHVVPIEDALSVLDEFLAPLRSATRGGERQYAIAGTDVVASAAATRSGKGVDTLLYIVNFENGGGYALLGADDRIDDVIALVDEGNMSAEEFLAAAGNGTSSTRASDIPPHKELLFRNILYYCDQSIDDVEGGQPIPVPYYDAWIQIVKRDPLLTTKWHQKGPYNGYCPVVDGENCVAGCVAIALAQIAAYNKMAHNVGPDVLHEIPLDWNGILDRVISENADASAAALLVYAMGREVDTKYGTDKSSSNIKKAARALPWLGYWDVSNTRYNHDIIELMVGERRLPVYMRGTVESTDGSEGGHAWVVDGHYRYEQKVYNKDPNDRAGGNAYIIGREYVDLVHCNFGWNGDCDGYFISNMFQNGPAIPDSGVNQIENLVDKRMLSYQL